MHWQLFCFCFSTHLLDLDFLDLLDLNKISFYTARNEIIFWKQKWPKTLKPVKL